MTDLFTYLIFGTLVYLFITFLKQKCEYFTSNTELSSGSNTDENENIDEDYNNAEYDADYDVDSDENYDEDYDSDYDDENIEDKNNETDDNVDEDYNQIINDENDSNNTNNTENIEVESNSKSEPVYINESNANVSDTIILKDSVRRDSKVSSSLNFTYIDEKCSNIVHSQSSKPIEKISSEPKTPLIQQTCNINENSPSWNNSKCEKTGPTHLNYYQKKMNNDKSFHSEMFDDSELKPKPHVDSPYGFVYFPNKYWKQWHTKSKVCTPVSECKVLPTYTEGTPVDVLDYTQIGSMMPKFEYAEEYESK